MSANSTPPDVLLDTLRAFKQHGSQGAAARALGISRSTFQNRLHRAEADGIVLNNGEEIEFPDLPSSELPADQLIEQACARFEGHLTAREARRWMEIKVKTNKPIGVCFVGDPHIDNNGCNWPLLRRDIALLNSTPGMHAVNIGDLTDNWIGRLVRLYADQEMSKKQAWKLAKYFMRDAGINWLCHIMGNHDAWGDGPYLIKANAAPQVPVEDWQLLPFESVGYLKRAYVSPDHRGHGLQLKMIEARLNKARELGWHQVVAETTSHWSAHNLALAGFEMVEVEQTWGEAGSLYFSKMLT
jgi:GNAT superfamily N-acetyltransferase